MNFRLFSFPVHVQTTVWFVAGFILLLHASGGPQSLFVGLLLAAALFGSILVHELGHAVAASRLGLGPCRITLHGFGGLTAFARSPGARQGVMVSGAGPAAGLTLGAVSLALLLGSGAEGLLAVFLGYLVWVNVVWSLFNLLPMAPLDGGMVLIHILRGSGMKTATVLTISKTLSVAVAVLVGLVAVYLGQWFVLIIVALILTRNLRGQT